MGKAREIMDDRLCIHSLGGLSIQLEDQPVEDLGTRKAEALLVYLAGTGRSQAREVLAELLWDDRAQSQAQANLRVALSGLRKPLEEYLEVTRESVGLNPERAVWYDAGELEAGLQAARENGGIHTQVGAEQAAEALALYQGEFLEGFYLKDARGFKRVLTQEYEELERTGGTMILSIKRGDAPVVKHRLKVAKKKSATVKRPVRGGHRPAGRPDGRRPPPANIWDDNPFE